MTATGAVELSPIGASIDNPGDWDAIAAQIASGTGVPSEVTPELVAGMIASAVPLLYAADVANEPSRLRGTFADPVIAQCQRNAGSLMGARPSSAVIHLVGAHMVDGHSVLRAHVCVNVQLANGDPTVNNQFWDLQLAGQVTVGMATCPNCGAPIATGDLICRHCGNDVRNMVEVPIVVSRLELY